MHQAQIRKLTRALEAETAARTELQATHDHGMSMEERSLAAQKEIAERQAVAVESADLVLEKCVQQLRWRRLGGVVLRAWHRFAMHSTLAKHKEQTAEELAQHKKQAAGVLAAHKQQTSEELAFHKSQMMEQVAVLQAEHAAEVADRRRAAEDEAAEHAAVLETERAEAQMAAENAAKEHAMLSTDLDGRRKVVENWVGRGRYLADVGIIWRAWRAYLWERAETDYIGNLEALENERMILNDELHSTKATAKHSLEAAAKQCEATMAAQGVKWSGSQALQMWADGVGDGEEECEGSALQKRAWAAFCDGVLISKHTSTQESEHDATVAAGTAQHEVEVAALQEQLRRAKRAGYGRKTQVEFEYGGPDFDCVSEGDQEDLLEREQMVSYAMEAAEEAGGRFVSDVIEPGGVLGIMDPDATVAPKDGWQATVFGDVWGSPRDCADSDGAQAANLAGAGAANTDWRDDDSDAGSVDAEIHEEMRGRGLVVMGQKQQTMLFWKVLGALMRDRRQFRCTVHCFQSWKGWWDGRKQLARTTGMIKSGQKARLRKDHWTKWRTRAAEQWLSKPVDGEWDPAEEAEAVSKVMFLHGAQEEQDKEETWHDARAHRTAREVSHANAQATAAEHNATMMISVLDNLGARRDHSAVRHFFRAWHFHWQKWLEAAHLTATVEQMQSEHARELAELETHHTAAGGAVAARGEALLAEQKLARSRDKMLLHKIIFSRAFRARSYEETGPHHMRRCFLMWASACQKEMRLAADKRAMERVRGMQERLDNALDEIGNATSTQPQLDIRGCLCGACM